MDKLLGKTICGIIKSDDGVTLCFTDGTRCVLDLADWCGAVRWL